MAKDEYTKTLEKQMKEQKKQAEATERRDRAKSIIDGQPTVAGFRIMDKDSEELLSIILNNYTENEENNLHLNSELIPKRMRFSTKLELEKLKMYGVIASYIDYFSFYIIYLSIAGIEYFENKERALKNSEKLTHDFKPIRKEYDLFLSHANADKLSYVDGLYETFSLLGINVFYDKASCLGVIIGKTEF
jgi:hypothetical protein